MPHCVCQRKVAYSHYVPLVPISNAVAAQSEPHACPGVTEADEAASRLGNMLSAGKQQRQLARLAEQHRNICNRIAELELEGQSVQAAATMQVQMEDFERLFAAGKQFIISSREGSNCHGQALSQMVSCRRICVRSILCCSGAEE